ncbi:GTP cyclohydrolase II [Ectothiorhodospiraceae bacterium WFHF3C12]|nr:GTP cyclohydrolase II [Ectothiorhodospiraceae bacterium WFHF3C12]
MSANKTQVADTAVEHVAEADLPTPWGVFRLHGFRERANGKEHVAITMGRWEAGDAVLVRVHSECLTGDALFSQRCDCGPQLEAAMRQIAEAGAGAVVYLRQEGRGIGLINKIRAYALQDTGADTVQANEALGFMADARDYGAAAGILRGLAITQLRLLTNNPAKVDGLTAHGLTVTERLPLRAGHNPHNRAYLEAKAAYFGHRFDADEHEP